jgi:hypothetical protein
MKPLKLLIISAIALALLSAHATANDLAKHTAVAMSPSTAAYGLSYNQDSAQSARLVAYLNCQKHNYPANDCVVFSSMSEPGVYVLAIGEGHHAAVVGGKKTQEEAQQEEAQQAAIAACARQDKACAWKYGWQNGEIK